MAEQETNCKGIKMNINQTLLVEQIHSVKKLIDENIQLKKELKEAQLIIRAIAKQKLEDIHPAENSLEVKAQLLEWCINLVRQYTQIN